MPKGCLWDAEAIMFDDCKEIHARYSSCRDSKPGVAGSVSDAALSVLASLCKPRRCEKSESVGQYSDWCQEVWFTHIRQLDARTKPYQGIWPFRREVQVRQVKQDSLQSAKLRLRRPFRVLRWKQ